MLLCLIEEILFISFEINHLVSSFLQYGILFLISRNFAAVQHCLIPQYEILILKSGAGADCSDGAERSPPALEPQAASCMMRRL